MTPRVKIWLSKDYLSPRCSWSTNEIFLNVSKDMSARLFQKYFFIIIGSTLLLTVSTILNEYCAEDGKCGTTLPLRKSEYIGICIGLELIVLVSVLGAYICKLLSHAKTSAIFSSVKLILR